MRTLTKQTVYATDERGGEHEFVIRERTAAMRGCLATYHDVLLVRCNDQRPVVLRNGFATEAEAREYIQEAVKL